jgi:tetratricopeptide (TPR) repeat protein
VRHILATRGKKDARAALEQHITLEDLTSSRKCIFSTLQLYTLIGDEARARERFEATRDALDKRHSDFDREAFDLSFFANLNLPLSCPDSALGARRKALAKLEEELRSVDDETDEGGSTDKLRARALAARNNLAWCLCKRGDFREARGLLEGRDDLTPMAEDTLALALMRTGEHARARRLLEGALKHYPDSVTIRAHHLAAEVYGMGSIDERALSEKLEPLFGRARLAQNPLWESFGLRNLGDALAARGADGSAQSVYRHIAAHSGPHPVPGLLERCPSCVTTFARHHGGQIKVWELGGERVESDVARPNEAVASEEEERDEESTGSESPPPDEAPASPKPSD